MAALPSPSLETRRPFTRADAISAGVPGSWLRGARFRRIFTGVYVDSRVPDHPLIRAQAALLLHPPSAHISHVSAARILGLPVPADPREHVTVARPQDRTKRQGIRCHVAARAVPVVTVSGVRVSRPHQVFVELASMLSLVDLVVVGDALVRMGKATPASLVRACEESDLGHAREALTAAGYVRAEVDSPMETRLRMLLVLAGLPEPEVNHKIRAGNGTLVRRFDLSYPSVRLIVEYDGRQHVDVQANWQSDLDRREELDDGGWRILVVTSKGIYRDPAGTVARVHRALKRAGWRGLPAHPADAWRRHFPPL